MLKMVDGSGIIGVDMVCPLGVSAPQPPNYDRVELEGTGMLVLPNSLDAPLERLELGGKTEQVQTSGKNLIDYKKIVVGLLNFVDGTFSGIYHTYFTTDFIEIESGDYVISHNSNVGIQSYALYDINNKTYVSGKAENNKVNVLNKCLIRISFNTKPETDVSSNPIDYAKKCNIQLEKGTTATPYEQYTGGKPSPSQEYQQEVKNTGKLNADTQKYEVGVKVTGKNLFDREKAKDVSNWISIEGDGYLKFPIRAKKGSMITFSYEEKLTEGKKFYLGIAKKETGSVIAWLHHDANLSVSNSKYTIVSEEGYVYLMCNKNAIQNFLDAIQTLQVEISQTQTEYEPYKEQTLTLTSDRPITKWDRLVEQGGEIGWLYGGKIIDSYNSEQIDAEYMSSTGSLTVGATVLYKLKTTEFVPIPQSEQNAIRALKTYYPTTVITADGGELDPDIKVTYRKEI